MIFHFHFFKLRNLPQQQRIFTVLRRLFARQNRQRQRVANNAEQQHNAAEQEATPVMIERQWLLDDAWCCGWAEIRNEITGCVFLRFVEDQSWKFDIRHDFCYLHILIQFSWILWIVELFTGSSKNLLPQHNWNSLLLLVSFFIFCFCLNFTQIFVLV